MREFTVATANTQLGRAVRTPGGLEGVIDVDALLLQEVDSDRDDLETFFNKETDLSVIAAESLGLAIALNKNHDVERVKEHFIQSATKSYLLPKISKHSKALSIRMRDRGVLEVRTTVNQRGISLLTTHPQKPLRPKSRAEHLKKLPSIIGGVPDIAILGADMNHWPQPSESDEQMRIDACMKRAQINKKATWHPEKSRQKSVAWLLAKFGITYSGQLDAILYHDSKFKLDGLTAEVIDIESDHSALKATFPIQ